MGIVLLLEDRSDIGAMVRFVAAKIKLLLVFVALDYFTGSSLS